LHTLMKLSCLGREAYSICISVLLLFFIFSFVFFSFKKLCTMIIVLFFAFDNIQTKMHFVLTTQKQTKNLTIVFTFATDYRVRHKLLPFRLNKYANLQQK
jgi:hypothetical protein